jgi:hypothetical protein
MFEVPNDYGPDHATDVKLLADFIATPRPYRD